MGFKKRSESRRCADSRFRILRQGILYGDVRYMAAFPSLTLTALGDILLIFRRAPDSRWLLRSDHDPSLLGEVPDGAARALASQVYHWNSRSQLVAIRIDQEIKNFSNPCGLSVDGQAADQDASLLRLEGGDILLASFSWYPMPPAFAALALAWGGQAIGGPANTGCSFIEWGSYLRRSSDHGRSWSEREYLPALPGAADLVPGLRPSHGGCVRGQGVWREGEVLIPCYGKIGKLYAAHIFASQDQGHRWAYRGVIASSDQLNFYEPSLTLCDDGSLIAWLRTDEQHDRMASARSTDGGHTWSSYELHQIIGHPAHGLRLRSGNIFLCYGYRHEGFGVRARLLNPLGDNVDSAREFVIRDDGHGSDLGYPWAVELDDARVLIAYYFTAESGLRQIEYSLLEFEV